jgi:hypothetical protein
MRKQCMLNNVKIVTKMKINSQYDLVNKVAVKK